MWFPDSRPDLREAAVRWAAAAPRVLLVHLRHGADLVSEVRGVLAPEEVGPRAMGAMPARAGAVVRAPGGVGVRAARAVPCG
jgi:hypothetical protein